MALDSMFKRDGWMLGSRSKIIETKGGQPDSQSPSGSFYVHWSTRSVTKIYCNLSDKNNLCMFFFVLARVNYG